MRGKLIHPFWAQIALLDTLETSKDPDGSGPLTSGYDPVFKEPVALPPATGEGAGAIVREEKLVRLPCQVEVTSYDKLQILFNGNSPDGFITLIFHFKDLERLGFVDESTGEATLRIGDRLDSIYDKCGRLVQWLREPLFCVQVQPSSFGLGGARNLLQVTYQSRDSGMKV